MINVEYKNACKYNIYVECEKCTKCGHCGWNPVVAEKRSKKIRENRQKIK